MNMMVAAGGRSELRRQSRVVRALGSPFIADLLEAADRHLELGPRTAALIAGWPGDPAAAALGLRLNSAMHALARRGSPPALATLFQQQHGDFDAAIAEALQGEDRFISEWMLSPTQTNEVGRAAAITASLMVLRHKTGMPAELLEIGSSCGLNLNLARYGYTLGETRAGDVTSPVQITPVWWGTAPEATPIEIVSARGVDLKPLDPQDAATRERLLAYIWADQPARAARLERAIELARRFSPRVDRADALSWLEARLAEPQTAGICRVVFNSMVLQYLSAGDRRGFDTLLDRAGARATRECPLAWISFEWTPTRSEVRLTLKSWPDGGKRLLALAHPYGDWIEWRP